MKDIILCIEECIGAIHNLVEMSKEEVLDSNFDILLIEKQRSCQIKVSSDAPLLAIMAPHPDDDVLMSTAALNFQKSGYEIQTIAVTLGSDRQRQQERMHEAKKACEFLGFGFSLPRTREWYCLEKINPRTRLEEPRYWAEATENIAHIILEINPYIVCVPSKRERHPTHVGTNLLLQDSLNKIKENGGRIRCFILESEIQGQLEQPNLMVEPSPDDVKRMSIALLFHKGEILRNDYHIRLPFILAGNPTYSESLSGYGKSSPKFSFASFYEAMLWDGNECSPAFDGVRFVASNDKLEEVLLSGILMKA